MDDRDTQTEQRKSNGGYGGGALPIGSEMPGRLWRGPVPTSGGGMDAANCAVRMSARAMLESKIHEFESRAESLRSLSRSLPLELPREADEALFSMLVAVR